MKNISLFYIGIIILLLNGCEYVPKRQLVFFNASDKTYNVVLEKDSVYVEDKMIKPHSNAFVAVPYDTYNIIVFDESGKYIRSYDNYEIVAPKEIEGLDYLCFDVEGNTTYALVLSSYLYEANNSLAEAIQSNMGTNDIISGYYKP